MLTMRESSMHRFLQIHPFGGYPNTSIYRTSLSACVFTANQISKRLELGFAGNTHVYRGGTIDESNPTRLCTDMSSEKESLLNQPLLNIAGRIAQFGGWTVDLPGHEVSWSDEMRAIHDVSPDAALELEQVFNFYAPQSQVAARKTFETCFQHGTSFDLELEMLTSKGRHIWVRCIGEALRNVAGSIVRVQGACQDVTERKQTEEKLVYERDLLRMLLDSSPDHIYFKDVQSRFIKCSTAQARQFGVESSDALVGKTDFDIFSEEHARPAFEDEQEIIRTGQPMVNKVERETWQDGRPDSWALTTKMPLRSKDGTIIGTFGITKDISGIKQTENELAYQRDLLATLMDNLPDSLFFKDLQSRLVQLSRSEAESLFQVSLSRHQAAFPGAALPLHLRSVEVFREYAIGKSDADFYGAEQAAEFAKSEQEVLRTGLPMIEKSEIVGVHPDGHADWHLSTKCPWRDQDGRIIGTFGTSKNISKLKLAEKTIEEVHKKLVDASRLAGMAEIATNVLHNVGNILNSVNVSVGVLSAQLRASKLKGLSRAVGLMDEHADDLGEFLVHDARGKLLPMYLRELAQTLAAEQAAMAEELGQLGKSVDHIKEVVATQQSHAGAPSIVESVRWSELVDDALRMNVGALERHKVQIVKDFDHLPMLLLDRHRLLQILVNLIGNSKQALGGLDLAQPTITLGARLVATEQEQVLRITVADNGEGIAPENLTRIFAHGFTTRKTGHGFGLHSCVLAAQEMGGSLAAYSAGAGHGAIFTLDIPVATPEGAVQ